MVLLNSGFVKRSKSKAARHWWLTPVILATGEAEIGRIMV
jgi:hypothetical protein